PAEERAVERDRANAAGGNQFARLPAAAPENVAINGNLECRDARGQPAAFSAAAAADVAVDRDFLELLMRRDLAAVISTSTENSAGDRYVCKVLIAVDSA